MVQRAVDGDVQASRWVLANLPLDLFQPQTVEQFRAQALLPTTAAGRGARRFGLALIVIGALLLAGGVRSFSPRFKIPAEASITIAVSGALAVIVGIILRSPRAVEVAIARGGMRTSRAAREVANRLSSHFSEVAKEARSRERTVARELADEVDSRLRDAGIGPELRMFAQDFEGHGAPLVASMVAGEGIRGVAEDTIRRHAGMMAGDLLEGQVELGKPLSSWQLGWILVEVEESLRRQGVARDLAELFGSTVRQQFATGSAKRDCGRGDAP